MTLTHTDYDQMFGKNLTVYGESKMIQVKKSYVLELTEDQAREFYNILSDQKKYGQITADNEITLVYHELKKIFDRGIRSTESFENSTDAVGAVGAVGPVGSYVNHNIKVK